MSKYKHIKFGEKMYYNRANSVPFMNMHMPISNIIRWIFLIVKCNSFFHDFQRVWSTSHIWQWTSSTSLFCFCNYKFFSVTFCTDKKMQLKFILLGRKIFLGDYATYVMVRQSISALFNDIF